jgi:hypothetical protein
MLWYDASVVASGGAQSFTKHQCSRRTDYLTDGIVTWRVSWVLNDIMIPNSLKKPLLEEFSLKKHTGVSAYTQVVSLISWEEAFILQVRTVLETSGSAWFRRSNPGVLRLLRTL